MLFGKKKNKEIENSQETVQVTETPVKEEEKEATAPSAATFSTRISGVFGQMYRFILSVDITNNVYQVESGKLEMEGKPIPIRGYYDQLYEIVRSKLYADEEAKLENFTRKRITDSLLSGKTFISDILCLHGFTGAEENEVNYRYYEIRAVKIPSQDTKRVRCIIFVQEVKNENDNGSTVVKKVEKRERDWSDVRFRKLSDGQEHLYFEYEIEEDTLYLHLSDGNERITKNYLTNIVERSDYTVFHDDTTKVKKAFKDAIKGKKTECEIRYRTGGDHKMPFHVHRMICAPAEDDEKNIHWLVGALTDIDEVISGRIHEKDVATQIDLLVEEFFAEIIEIDTEKDIYTVIKRQGDHFVLTDHTQSFTGKLRDMLNHDRFDENSRAAVKQLMTKGYLEKKCLNGSFEVQLGIHPIGVQDVQYFNDTYSPMTKPHHFLRVRRDITATRNASRLQFANEEQSRVIEQNRYMLDTMASLVEFRNVESGAHITHVCKLTEILLTDVNTRSIDYHLTRKQISLYSEAAIMHDIGKITVPDSVLNKPGKLTPEEYDKMKEHTINGARIIEKISMPGQEELKEYCHQVALGHHERWDGKGYPKGCVGDEVPIGVQAVGLADCYDAMVSVRCYKQSLPHSNVIDFICEGNCGVFNPVLLESLKACSAQLKAVYDDEAYLHEVIGIKDIEDVEG